MAGKDLRIEARSRVTMQQIAPFGLIVLLLFAFALDPDRGVLKRVAPGLFWVTVLLASLLAVSRAFGIEADNGARDGLRLSGLDGPALFLGKAAAIAVQLVALESRARGVRCGLLRHRAEHAGPTDSGDAGRDHRRRCHRYPLRRARGRFAGARNPRAGVAPAGGGPGLLGATRSWEAAIDGVPSDAWPWVGLLGVFALLFTAIGMLAFGPLLEEA